jgi:hypothetical protein
MFALPAGIPLAAYALESSAPGRRLLARLLLIVVLIGSVATITRKEIGPQEDWRPVTDRLYQLTREGKCVVSADPDGLIYYEFFRPSLKASECRSSEKNAVLVADPYTPPQLDDLKTHELLEKGYKKTRNDTLDGFRLAYFAR